MLSESSWKVVSFDVGIKNMAYCVFTQKENNLEILDWNVVDLIGAPPPINKSCDVMLKNKKTCGKKAKFTSSDQCFCDKHAKENTVFLLPTRERSPKYVKKLKLGELHAVVVKDNVPEISLSDKRAVLIDKILAYYAARCLVPLNYTTKRADDCSIISIGQKIKESFNAIPAMDDVTHVLIENQISTLASRMSIIQGLLAQYFIMKQDGDFVLEFISSKNKLKNFDGKTLPTKDTTASQKYRQHKTDSILYARQLLETYTGFRSWLPVLNTPKKDDLADCFLQGMWYLQKDR
jgi:hypothetical protein